MWKRRSAAGSGAAARRGPGPAAAVALAVWLGVACGGDGAGDVGAGGVACASDADCEYLAAGLTACQRAVCEGGGPAARCAVVPVPDATPCDDGDPCTEETACASSACAGRARDCDDDEPCTADTCVPVGDGAECTHTLQASACDDGDLCTFDDVCTETGCVGTPSPLCQCDTDADCAPFQDADPCNGVLGCVQRQCVTLPGSAVTCDAGSAGPCATVSCDREVGACVPRPTDEGGACDDGNACTYAERCVAGECVGVPRACPEGEPCRVVACDPAVGCTSTDAQDGTACDDGEPCTVATACAGGVCVGVASGDCPCASNSDCAAFEDGDACDGDLRCEGGGCLPDLAAVLCPAPEVPCRLAACEPSSGACVEVDALAGAPCDDGDGCTVGDRCVDGACEGVPAVCPGGGACEEALCDPAAGCIVLAEADGVLCDDGDPCTANDVCAGGSCGGTALGSCACGDDGDCEVFEDGDACSGTLRCVAGLCKLDPGSVSLCGVPPGAQGCAVPTCEPATGACGVVAVGDGAPCDDGDACTAGDVCAAGVCVGGAGVSCDDGDLCTSETCVPALGCVATWTTAACDDGNACTAGDRCDQGQCVGVPTSAGSCGCGDDADCAPLDDGDACNGVLVCVGGACVTAPGSVVACDPALAGGGACAVVTCEPATGACEASPLPDGAACDDGDACTSGTVCGGATCGGGEAVACDDGNPCTADGCDPAGGCTHPAAPAGTPCDDGEACTVGDGCAGGVCQPGEAQGCEGCVPEWTLGCGDVDTWDTAWAEAEGSLVDAYGCAAGAGGYGAKEYVYTFVAPWDGMATVTLSGEEAVTDVLVLEAPGGAGCDPGACVAWGHAQAEFWMDEGATYRLVVDGAVGQEGGYSVALGCVAADEVDCADGVDEDDDGATDCADDGCAGDPACGPESCEPAWVLACGSSQNVATTSALATSAVDGYGGCDNPWSYEGPEVTWLFQVDGDAPGGGAYDVTVSLQGETGETDVLVLADPGGPCDPGQCLGWGLDSVTFQAGPDEVFYVVVDGFEGATGAFGLSVACEEGGPDDELGACDDGVDDDGDGLTDCEDPDCFGGDPVCEPACQPDDAPWAELTCPSSDDYWNHGDEGSADLVDAYGCEGFDYSGPEYVYTVVADADGPMTATLSEETAPGQDSDVIVLEDRGLGCNPASCLAWGTESATWEAVAGTTYYVVVDGFAGAVGDYTLAFTCGDP